MLSGGARPFRTRRDIADLLVKGRIETARLRVETLISEDIQAGGLAFCLRERPDLTGKSRTLIAGGAAGARGGEFSSQAPPLRGTAKRFCTWISYTQKPF